jgi:hypothetical protein
VAEYRFLTTWLLDAGGEGLAALLGCRLLASS